MWLNPVSPLLTSCLVVSSVIFNHLIMEIFFFLTECRLPMDFGNAGTAGRRLHSALGLSSSTRVAALHRRAPPRQPRTTAAARRPPRPISGGQVAVPPLPAAIPGLRAGFSRSRGEDSFPAVVTSPASTGSRREATAISKPLCTEARTPRTPQSGGAAPQSLTWRARSLTPLGRERRCVTTGLAGAAFPRPRPARALGRRDRPRVLLETGAPPSTVRHRRAAVAARGHLGAGAGTTAPCEAPRRARGERGGVCQKRSV